jgi:triosephosphate isomerase
MYLSYAETQHWLRSLRARESELGGVGVFVVPTFPAIGEAKAILAGSEILYGAQDTYWEDRGPFTGEVSPKVLKELGCTMVEIGHPERRALFGEDNDRVGRKTAAALRQGLVPLVCIGEPRRQPEGSTIAEVIDQLRAALGPAVRQSTEAVDAYAIDSLIVAYEPMWAIGGQTGAPSSYLVPVVQAIRQALTGLWHGDSSILYGGSVNSENALELLDSGVDGLFVGRASLDLDEFIRIIKKVDRHR